MLKPNIRILDFDASVRIQYNLLVKYPHQIIPLTGLAPYARLWMNRQTSKAIRQRIEKTEQNHVTFLGSGDFHHISSLLLNQFTEPISLINFDFHPDWDILSPRYSCGAWINQALKRKNILKCILLGVSSDDISNPWIHSGNLGALKNDRLEIYPYTHECSTVFLRHVPENKSLKLQKSFLNTRIYWEELKKKNLRDFFGSVIKRLPAKRVYVSIDKDCLCSEYALTNWEEGKLSLDELLLMLRLIKDNLDIVGLDITGEYSNIFVSGWLKNLISRADHPREVKAQKYPQSEVARINESTNLKILETLFP
ncbi:MAG: arginase family protein [Candidatus Omnitrophota bacterium]|jgi:arginase family enzyme